MAVVLRERAAGLVGRADVAAEEARDLPVAVQGDVEAEVEGQKGAVPADDGLGGVAFENAPGAARIADGLGVVVAHDRGDVGHRREDPLVAAREAGHEVGLDEAQDDAPVGLHVVAVHQDRHAVRPGARGEQGRGVVGVVVDHAVAAQDVGADHRGQLLRGVGPVRARAVDDREPLGGHVVELREEPGQEPLRWGGGG